VRRLLDYRTAGGEGPRDTRRFASRRAAPRRTAPHRDYRSQSKKESRKGIDLEDDGRFFFPDVICALQLVLPSARGLTV